MFTPAIGCSRLLSAVNDLTATNLKKKTSWKPTRLRFCEKTAPPQRVSPFYHIALYMSSVADFLVNCHERHQEALHCHQLEEELDGWCDFLYFQNGTGLSCCSPDSWCKRFNVVNASLKSERFLTGPVFPELLRERSTNSVCIESTLLASYDRRNLSARSRPSGYRLLQFDHVRVETHEIRDLFGIDRKFL